MIDWLMPLITLFVGFLVGRWSMLPPPDAPRWMAARYKRQRDDLRSLLHVIRDDIDGELMDAGE